tara:strand:- start:561 stop:878 length:318 start_codon:yes stop_codon:yes gene_type:complete
MLGRSTIGGVGSAVGRRGKENTGVVEEAREEDTSLVSSKQQLQAIIHTPANGLPTIRNTVKLCLSSFAAPVPLLDVLAVAISNSPRLTHLELNAVVAEVPKGIRI